MITIKIGLISSFKKSRKVVPEPFIILEYADVVVINRSEHRIKDVRQFIIRSAFTCPNDPIALRLHTSALEVLPYFTRGKTVSQGTAQIHSYHLFLFYFFSPVRGCHYTAINIKKQSKFGGNIHVKYGLKNADFAVFSWTSAVLFQPHTFTYDYHTKKHTGGLP